MSLLAKPIYIFIMALILAILEVQIEGKHGWAANLPTWRPQPNKWYVKIFKKFTAGKEMTGYHLSIFSFVFLIFHLPFFWGNSWSLSKEAEALAVVALFFPVWDYLWFVVNPHFTVKDFKGEHIFWHRSWFLNLPSDYWLAFLISLVLAVVANYFLNPGYLINWLVMVVVFLILTILTKSFIKKFKPAWE